MSYCIYLRKSRADIEAEQHGEGETLARHEKILTELACKLRLNVTEIYREIVSGETIAARPVVQQLLSEVEDGIWEGVLVVEVERLARGDTMDQGQVAKSFKYNNTKIITPMKTYDPSNEFDEEYFEFGLFMSRREYKTINRRLQRGRLASVKEGKYIASTAPYGYKKVKINNDKGYTLEVIPEEANIVKQIFAWFVSGMGMPTICIKLDSMGITPKVNKEWSRSSIKDMITNPSYIGKIRWQHKKETKNYTNGKIIKTRTKMQEYMLYDGIHEAIIDEATFQDAQIRLQMNKKATVSSKDFKNPLMGIMYCKKCGRLMTRLAPSTKNKYSTLKCPNTHCDNVSAPLDLVEQKLIESLGQWLDNFKFSWEADNEANKENKEIDILTESLRITNQKLESLTMQFNKTFDLLEQGVYTTEVFMTRNKMIEKQIEHTKESLLELESNLKDEQKRIDARTTFIPKIERILDIYYNSDVIARNEMLKEVIERVTYIKTEKNTRSKLNNSNFDIVIYPNIQYH